MLQHTRRSPVTRNQLLHRMEVVNAVIGAAPAKRLWLSWGRSSRGPVATLWWGPVGQEDDSLYCHSTHGNRAMWEYIGGMLDAKVWFRGVDEGYCTSAGLLPVWGTNG
jgi:hypothetical protein